MKYLVTTRNHFLSQDIMSQDKDVCMKPIPGYPEYVVTSDGDIISLKEDQPKVLSQRIHHGYYHVYVKTGKGIATRRSQPVHKLILMAYYGARTEKQQCRHLNGNALDNRISNIVWGTAKENVQDSKRHGTAACLRAGEESNSSKLKTKDVLNIAEQIEAGRPLKKIANDYHITRRHVCDIKLKRTWAHLWGV